MNRWINVHDRLPEEDELVLAAVTGRDKNIEWEEAYLLARFYPGEGWMLEDYPEAENFRITWWMKLPDDLPDADVVQTNADRIREMRDEELAELFYGICSERDHIFLERMRDAGFENAVMLIETPIESMMTHLNWLRQPCKED